MMRRVIVLGAGASHGCSTPGRRLPLIGPALAAQLQAGQILSRNGPVMERGGQQHAGGAGALKL